MSFALAFAAALVGTFTISDRTEFRLRDPGVDPTQPSLDIDKAIDARLSLASRRTSLTLGYAPRLTLWDVNTAAIQPALMNGGDIRAAWHEKQVTLSLSEAASYGGANVASLSLAPAGSTPVRVDVVPQSRVIDYVSSTTALTAHGELARWTLDSMVAYQLSGGADSDAQAVLPFQSGPAGEVRADYTASRLAHLVTVASASQSSFSSGPDNVLTEVDEVWRAEWSRRVRTRLTLGVSEARVREGALMPHVYTTYPVAEALLEHEYLSADDRLAWRLSARVAPVVNRVLGTVDERLQGLLAGTWTHRKVAVNAFASAQQTVPADATNAVQLLFGEASVAYTPTQLVTLELGVRGLAQRAAQPVAGGAPVEATFLQAIAFTAVTIRAPTLRF